MEHAQSERHWRSCHGKKSQLEKVYSETNTDFKACTEPPESVRGDESMFLVDEKLSRYDILFPLGRGSSSFVYKATDLRTGELRVRTATNSRQSRSSIWRALRSEKPSKMRSIFWRVSTRLESFACWTRSRTRKMATL